MWTIFDLILIIIAIAGSGINKFWITIKIAITFYELNRYDLGNQGNRVNMEEI